VGALATSGLYAPTKLTSVHAFSNFDCGESSLNQWLHRRALLNQQSGASATYVVATTAGVVVGYYCLAAGSVALSSVPKNLKRNTPDPVPVTVLGRLAVDVNAQNKGIGRGMVRDAVLRTTQAADIIGIRAILVHALPSAKSFYLNCGFAASPVDPLVLMLKL